MKEESYCENKEEPVFYRIGIFSKMNKVTIKTLRHYDDIGLLKPAYSDETNGYRYYSSAQLPALYKILSLREMGFSLEEIKRVLNGASESELLLARKAQILKELATLTMRLSEVECYLSGYDSEYHVIIKEIPSYTVASYRAIIPSYSALTSIVLPMGEEMERLGCECLCPDYCYTIYHDDEYREENIDVEVCQAVTTAKEGSLLLTFKQSEPISEAACVLHKGSYAAFPKAYHSLFRWIAKNGYEVTGHSRESYIDGVWNKSHIEDWLTELQVPVKKRMN